jgi:hypothetical protein
MTSTLAGDTRDDLVEVDTQNLRERNVRWRHISSGKSVCHEIN